MRKLVERFKFILCKIILFHLPSQYFSFRWTHNLGPTKQHQPAIYSAATVQIRTQTLVINVHLILPIGMQSACYRRISAAMSTGYVKSPTPTDSAPAFFALSLNWIMHLSQFMAVAQIRSHTSYAWAEMWDWTNTLDFFRINYWRHRVYDDELMGAAQRKVILNWAWILNKHIGSHLSVQMHLKDTIGCIVAGPFCKYTVRFPNIN